MKKINLKKIKISCSILAVTVIISSLFFSFYFPHSENNSISNIANKNVNSNVQESLSVQNSNDVLPKATPNNFKPIFNDVNSKPVATKYGFLGMADNGKNLVLTSYEGVIVWQNNIDKNELLKQSLLKDSTPLTDLTNYTYNNLLFSEELDAVIVITANSETNGDKTHVKSFAIVATTGLNFYPVTNKDGSLSVPMNIVSLPDNVVLLNMNSDGQIIALPFADYTKYSVDSRIIRFSPNNGIVTFLGQFLNKPIDITKSDWKFVSLIPLAKGSGLNAMVMISNNSKGYNQPNSTNGAQSTGYDLHMYIVNDSLNPIMNSSSLIQIELSPYIYSAGSTLFKTQENVVKYGYYIKQEGTKHEFIWLTSGLWNQVSIFSYDTSTKTLSKDQNLDLQTTTLDEDVFAYVYDNISNILYTSNSYTNTGAHIGYLNLNKSSISASDYQTLISITNGNIPENQIASISPVVSSDGKPINESPIVYHLQGSSNFVNGAYFQNKNTTTATSIQLNFKTYNDIQNEASTQGLLKDKLPSAIIDSDLVKLIKFNSTPSNGSFTTTVESKKPNDNLRNIESYYKVSYQSWWNTSSTSIFFIDYTINNFYDLNNFKFSFVENITGSAENDNKYNQQVSLKENSLPSFIKKSDVLKNFVIYNIIDKDGKKVTLNENDIVLTVIDDTLKVDVSLQKYLPLGFATDLVNRSFIFSGFASLNGYTSHFLTDNEQMTDQTIVDLKSNSFPSEIDESNIINDFVKLGPSYSNSFSDWTVTLVPDDIKGTLTVTMKYNSNNIPNGFPEEKKTIVQDKVISNFRSISSSFSTNLPSFTSFNTTETPVSQFEKYQAVEGTSQVSQTNLISSLKMPQISDYSKIEIKATNLSTANNDGYLDLEISLKDGASTTFFVNNTPYVFTTSNIAQLATSLGNSYPFKARWEISVVKEDFSWATPNGQVIPPDELKADNLEIDLNVNSYNGINKDMYANDVSKQNIESIFNSQNLNVIDLTLLPNRENGVLNVNLILLSPITNSTSYKTLQIYNFKKPISPLVIAIPSAIGAAIVISLIIFLIYLKVRNANLNKLVTNNVSKKYLDKLNVKKNKKINKMKLKKEKILKSKLEKRGKK